MQELAYEHQIGQHADRMSEVTGVSKGQLVD